MKIAYGLVSRILATSVVTCRHAQATPLLENAFLCGGGGDGGEGEDDVTEEEPQGCSFADFDCSLYEGDRNLDGFNPNGYVSYEGGCTSPDGSLLESMGVNVGAYALIVEVECTAANISNMLLDGTYTYGSAFGLSESENNCTTPTSEYSHEYAQATFTYNDESFSGSIAFSQGTGGILVGGDCVAVIDGTPCNSCTQHSFSRYELDCVNIDGVEAVANSTDLSLGDGKLGLLVEVIDLGFDCNSLSPA